MKQQINRLPGTGRVERARPLKFHFNNRQYQGYYGDTLASALIANDVRVVARSFKYHRPRGIIGCWAEEPNAILQIGVGASESPAMRATQVPLYEGLRARSIKGWPSVNLDLLSVTDYISPLLAAGFYYKTFMSSRMLWRLYEKLIRRAAGLGFCPSLPDPGRYDHVYAHCDVLVVGAGPAGLLAALAAGRAGARVILADDQSEPGGSMLASSAPVAEQKATQWVSGVLLELQSMPEVTVLKSSSVSGYFDHNFLTIMQDLHELLTPEKKPEGRYRLWKVRARQVVLAQGAHERPLVFCNNDRPGVMLASAVSSYVNRYAVRPGSRGVVFTNNDSAYQVAFDLHDRGVEVAELVDVRSSAPDFLLAEAKQKGIEVVLGSAVFDVRGAKRVKGAIVASLSESGDALTSASRETQCDFIAMSGGWNPTAHLHSQSGGKCYWDESAACFVPGAAYKDRLSAGAGNGARTLASCFSQGINAGIAAARRCGFEPLVFPPPSVDECVVAPARELWRIPSRKHIDYCPKQFLDFQNDTTVADIRLAVREGYDCAEHVKRYTALGFGTDQGKLGNVSGTAIVAQTLGKAIPEVGATTFRPPYTPVIFSAIAGRDLGESLFDPQRKTPLHSWHEQRGAVWELVGQWLRPRFYSPKGERMAAALRRECLSARRSVAIMDASTLGKIAVKGPDAAVFLDRVYPVNCGQMKPGTCRYSLMLGEDGMIKDDGTISRVADDSYYITTTTGGAETVLNWMEFWLQTEWPELQVYLQSVTEQFATITVSGPESRKLLEMLETDIDFSAHSFPFMKFRDGMLGSFPARVFRISFSGELSFEVNCDSRNARELWDLLCRHGETFGICPYGTEAMHVLRAEKGYVIVGQETDGTVIPQDLGMQWMLRADNDFIGKRSLLRFASRQAERRQLVGLLSLDGSFVVPEGAQLTVSPSKKKSAPAEGHVTSAYYSHAVSKPIALALLLDGRARVGEKLFAVSEDIDPIHVQVVKPCFYDVGGAKLKS